MPFQKYENGSVEESHTIDPDNLPIFLIPGIIGNGSELFALAEAINKKRGGRTPIYIYEEPIIDGEPLQFTLSEHASLIAEEVQEIRQSSPLPYILVGYSFGGILASEVAIKLQALHHDPRLYVIDEPSCAISRDHIKNDTETFKTDLVKIVNYAASLSGIKPITITNQLLTNLRLLTLEERIDQLASEVLDSQPASVQEAQENSFYTLLETAKRNLRNILLSETSTENKLTNVHLIFTNETALKYTEGKQTALQFTGGWDEICQNKPKHLNPALTSKLSKQAHMDLLQGKPNDLKEDSNAELVAGLITNNLKNEITQKDLMQRHMQEILRRNKKRSPIQFFNLFNTSKDFTSSTDAAPLDVIKPDDLTDEDTYLNENQSARCSTINLAA